MIVETTPLNGVMVVRSPVYQDARGYFTEVFHAARFAELGLPTAFVQDNSSRSHRGILRGLHYQIDRPQGKLVRAASGSIFDVAVDLRRSSSTFGQWFGMTLSAGDGCQLWVPGGCAHGFLVLSDHADVSYKCTSLYEPKAERTIRWDDPDVGIAWPTLPGSHPGLSAKDANAASFADAPTYE